MIGAVHACIGAGLGSLFKKKSAAFAAGVVSHMAADAVPHRDLDPKVEVPLLTGALAAIALWKGADSPEFWGAVGAVAPDIEHGLSIAGVISNEQKIFPTHIADGKFHARAGNERLSQLIISAVSLAVVTLNSKGK